MDESHSRRSSDVEDVDESLSQISLASNADLDEDPIAAVKRRHAEVRLILPSRHPTLLTFSSGPESRCSRTSSKSSSSRSLQTEADVEDSSVEGPSTRFLASPRSALIYSRSGAP
jgi:hypothetical protein